VSSVVDAECETATVRALRRDLAWQISKAMKTRGSSQRSLAAELRLPQPTVSKILNGRIESLSLELLLRLAVRLELSLVIQTGRDAAEAAVYRQVAPKPFVDGGRGAFGGLGTCRYGTTCCSTTTKPRVAAQRLFGPQPTDRPVEAGRAARFGESG
jgi:predicted XRE-type DNA-binding protein